MNRELVTGRYDAKLVKEKEKELKLISTEPVTFSQWARFLAFKTERLTIEDSDFIFVASSSLFCIRKPYRKMPIIVYRQDGDAHAFLPAQPTIEFIATGDGAGDKENFYYVVSTEGHVGYVVKYNPEWDEIKGPEIIGNNPMKASCVDELYLKERDFVFQAGRRLRTGDYCCSKNSGLIEKAQTLFGKAKGGREVNIPEALTEKSGELCTEPVSFQVKSTSLQKGVQTIYTTDGRTGYNIINRNDAGFLF